MLVISLFIHRYDIADKDYYITGNGSMVSWTDTNRNWYFKRVLSFA